MRWEWINFHYDIHLSGLCWVNNELMRFETEQSHIWYPWRNLTCHVFKLTTWEYFKWRFHQRAFELCVGTHWTYEKDKPQIKTWFKLKKPEWFWQCVMNLYYHFTLPID